MSASHLPPVPGPPPLHCAKCAEHNPHAAEHCRRCRAPLWVICKGCGKRSPRTVSRCPRCTDPLPGGVFLAVKRVVRKLARKLGR